MLFLHLLFSIDWSEIDEVIVPSGSLACRMLVLRADGLMKLTGSVGDRAVRVLDELRSWPVGDAVCEPGRSQREKLA